jgi:hypothetical protein
MRKLAIGILAAGTLVAAAPAMAQVYLEGPGVGVRVGPDRDYRDHDRWDRRSHRGWNSYAYERGCRTVTVRERTPDGRLIVRTRERC